MKAEIGEVKLKAFLVLIVNNLNKSFVLGKTMNDVQVAETVDLMIEEYPDLKLSDVKLCFKNAKKGYYGKLYDKIDCSDILGWLREYKTLKIENLRLSQNRAYLDQKQEEKTVPPSKEVLEMLKRTREELKALEVKPVVETKLREPDNGQKWLMQFHKLWIKQGQKRYSGGFQFITRYGLRLDQNEFLNYKAEQYARIRTERNKNK